MIRQTAESDGQIFIHDMHGIRHLHLDWCEIPDSPYAGADQFVRYALGKCRRDSNDPNLDISVLHDLAEIRNILNFDMIHRRTDDIWVLVE